MAVFVDDMKMPWRGMIMSHMMADDLEDLHHMAMIIGLRREWFQGDSSIPHYDVSESKRQLAIQYGAIEEGCFSDAMTAFRREARRKQNMARQDQTNFHSSLPVWKVEKFDLKGKKALRIECPNCDNAAVVLLVWKSDKTNRYPTRTCTYCMKTAIMPHREAELRP